MRGGTNRSFGIEVAELAGVEKAVTDRAKKILKNLEKNDLAKNTSFQGEYEEFQNEISEVERIIKDIDVNNLSPLQAFNILTDLQEKIKGN